MSRTNNFNPRAPRGARRGHYDWRGVWTLISIHEPHAEPDVWGKTEIFVFALISIHRPLAEPDSKNSQSLVCLYSFITAYFTGFCKHPTHTKRL